MTFDQAVVTTAPSKCAALTVRAGIGGEPIVTDIQECRALTFQPAPWGVLLVGSTSHPVGGDDLHLRVTVGVGCCLAVRSQSATVARPRSGAGSRSFMRTTVRVANDGLMAWCPEPGIATPGCDHLSESVVQLTANARLAWRDEILLDRRTDDSPGTWRSCLRVVRDGWPVVASELGVGPGSELWESPAVLEGARALSMYVVVDPGQEPGGWSSSRHSAAGATGVALPLAGPGVRILAWGDDLGRCRGVVEWLLEAAGVPLWAQARWRGAQVRLF